MFSSGNSEFHLDLVFFFFLYVILLREQRMQNNVQM